MEKPRIPPGPLFLPYDESVRVVVFGYALSRVLLTPRRRPGESFESVEAWEGISGPNKVLRFEEPRKSIGAVLVVRRNREWFIGPLGDRVIESRHRTGCGR